MLIKGQKIDNYIIDSESHTGQGNFSYVYRAINNNDKKIVALKICKINITPSDTKRFYKENEILHKLHFPRSCKRIIMPYSKVINDNNYHCYVMEFALYNLKSYLNKEYDKLSTNDKLEMFKKICEGVAYAHKKKIVHRDLWWDNVLMVCNNNIDEPKLCDFGRAKSFDEQEEQYKPQGVGGYEAIYPPENRFNIWEEAVLDKYIYADIYALGIVLFFIIANDPSLFHNVILGNYLQFIADEKLENISLLSTEEKKGYYNKWLGQLDMDLIKSHIKIYLPERTMEEKINAIICKLCHPDYRKRYNDVNSLIDHLNNI